MPVIPTYPGVYIQETPSGVRTISAVGTSVTAFIGFTPKGPVNKAVRIFDFGAYSRTFGGLNIDSELGYAVQQFFLNGGADAWVVRTATGADKAAITLKNADGTKNVLVLTAIDAGSWGNYLKVDVDYNTSNPDNTFNLTINEYIPNGTEMTLGRVETFRNLSMDLKSGAYAPNVITLGSTLMSAARHEDVTPAVLSVLDPGWSLSSDLSGLTLPGDLDDTKRFISIIIDGDGPHEVALFPQGGPPPVDLDTLSSAIESAVQVINSGLERFSAFSVKRADALGDNATAGTYLQLNSGTKGEQSSVQVLNTSKNSASAALGLGLANRGREGAAASSLRPAQTGSTSGDLADLSATDIAALNSAHQVTMTVSKGATSVGTQIVTLGSAVTSLGQVANKLQEAIRASSATQPAFNKATVQLIGTTLRIVSGVDPTDCTVTFADAGGGTLATKLKLIAATTNMQRYSPKDGRDGTPPNGTLLCGKLEDKSGIYALEDADIFNLMCIPRMAVLNEGEGLTVISEAVAYCEARRAFLLIDPPNTVDTPDEIGNWMRNKLTPSKNAAVYFPFINIPDPLDGYRAKAIPPSGAVAGLYARTDNARGVWKAPAGTDATLSNVQSLVYNLTDAENGVLNQLGINCLRTFPVYGRIAWGARTTVGSDQQASEWKYIPIRRLALFLEESLYRGNKWVVFEPNDEPLWSQIRLNIGSFMHGLFRQGAFQGTTPRDAYFVKCDKETTTQADIDRGIVNILVGFAPLKPAEFVIIQIQQIAGQIQS